MVRKCQTDEGKGEGGRGPRCRTLGVTRSPRHLERNLFLSSPPRMKGEGETKDMSASKMSDYMGHTHVSGGEMDDERMG